MSLHCTIFGQIAQCVFQQKTKGFEKAKDMKDVSTLRAKVYYLGVDLMQKEEASRTTSAASTASVGVHFAE